MSAGNERFSAEAAAWDSNPDVHRASASALQAILQFRPDLVEAKDKNDKNDNASADGLDVLEIGCGTGLLTLRLAPYVRSIVAVDAAQGMIDALQQKLAKAVEDDGKQGKQGSGRQHRASVTPVCLVLNDSEDPALPPADPPDASDTSSTAPRRKFDLVISHLVLHHIPDHPALLRALFGCLKPGGQLALTDFENFGPQARRFHAERRMAGVEFHGIEAALFAEQMRAAGFVDVLVQPAWEMTKAVERFPGEWNAGKPKGVELETMQFPFLLCRGTKP
ncbi:hypothetical protein SCUCBS95973_004861 [Sporothrix curviconia]|uniref:S-adenosyl-L-methionine-dependent methyltransferase n=1 Tax=Sporothrix curviconia TaxID=1260050 RepID=A0ABP0BSL6_9PEZI